MKFQRIYDQVEIIRAFWNWIRNNRSSLISIAFVALEFYGSIFPIIKFLCQKKKNILPFLTVLCEKCKCHSKSIGRHDAFSYVCLNRLLMICLPHKQHNSLLFPVLYHLHVLSNAFEMPFRWCRHMNIMSICILLFHTYVWNGTISQNFLT